MSHHQNMDANKLTNSADNTANYRTQSTKSVEGEHLSLSSVEQGAPRESSSTSSSSTAANPRAPFQTHSRHCCSLQRSRGVRDVRVICGGRYPIGSAGSHLISWPQTTSSMLQRSSPPMITPPAPHNSPVHHQPVASGPMIVCPTPNLIASAPASSACSSSSSLFSFSSSSEVSSPSTSSTSLSSSASSASSSVSSGETLEMDELMASSLDYRLHQLQIGSALSKLVYARKTVAEEMDEGAENDGDKNEEEGSSATKRRKKAAIDALEDIDEDDEDYEDYDSGFMMISKNDDQLKMKFLKGD